MFDLSPYNDVYELVFEFVTLHAGLLIVGTVAFILVWTLAVLAVEWWYT